MGGELIIRTNGEADLYSMNGEVSANLDLNTAASIQPEQAQHSALQAVAKWYQKTQQTSPSRNPSCGSSTQACSCQAPARPNWSGVWKSQP